MKIVVTGGAGSMALSSLVYILDQKDVSEVVIIDINKTRLDERISLLNDKRILGQVLDLADNKASAKIFAGSDVVLNCGFHTTCLSAQRSALEAGVNYVDFGSRFTMWDQLKDHSAFQKKGITSIIWLGTAPGMSSILAAYAAKELETVDTIEVKGLVANLVSPDKHSRALHFGFAYEPLVRFFDVDAAVLEKGEMKYYPARSMPETYMFKSGPYEIAILAHPEPEIFVHTFKEKGIKNCNVKYGFDRWFEKKLRFLTKLGFGKTEPINVKGNMIAPKEIILAMLNNQPEETKTPPNFSGQIVVIVKGEISGQKVEYTLTDNASATLVEKIRRISPFGSFRTGIYGAIGAMLLARGQCQKKGVYFPEQGIPIESYLSRALDYGLEVEVIRKTNLQVKNNI